MIRESSGSMDLETVSSLVTALVSAYNAGLENYTIWQRRNWQRNHYSAHEKGRDFAGGCCGLNTTLSHSAVRIRETYEAGCTIFGDGFSIGDDQCRGILQINLKQMQTRVDVLYSATRDETGPLGLWAMLTTSEAVRVSTLKAFEDLSQHLAIQRRVQRDTMVSLFPGPQSPTSVRSRSAVVSQILDELDVGEDEADLLTSLPISSPSKSTFQPNPPSPPPTPRTLHAADDLMSSLSPTSSRFASRPKSVMFSMFCPEAVQYQVIPTDNPLSKVCKCGNDWSEGPITLKDGLHLSTRFLAKSHRERSGFGCVLCIPSGRTGMFESAYGLRDHINTAHNKWQMLHDRDLTKR